MCPLEIDRASKPCRYKVEINSKYHHFEISFRGCLYYVFMPILQRQLAEFMHEYNAYSVRKQKDRVCPPGVPEDNFHFPERQGI